MARRKSYKPKRRSYKSKAAPSRRRRIGAAGKLNANSPLVKWGAVAIGYFLGPKINEQITKVVGDKVDAKIIGAGETGLGFLLAMKKGKKGMLQTVGGGVLLGAGIRQLMASFGIGGVGPYGRVPVIGASGPYGRVPVIGYRAGTRGYTPNNSLNGYTPSGTLGKGGRVMAGAMPGGSGISNDAGGSYMN